MVSLETINKELLYDSLREEVDFMRRIMKRKDETIRELSEHVTQLEAILKKNSQPNQLHLKGIYND
jgi:hypothetical protein